MLLNWETKTEISNYGFDIERLAEQNNEWMKIGFVNGSGNSNSPKQYSFTDNNVNSGKYSYRLKQIDSDGKYEYSRTIKVVIGTPNNFVLNQNYPNPFNPVTNIEYAIDSKQYTILKVYDVLGNEVAILVTEDKEAGSYEVEFDASSLTSGVYFYRLQAGSYIATKKMMLMK